MSDGGKHQPWGESSIATQANIGLVCNNITDIVDRRMRDANLANSNERVIDFGSVSAGGLSIAIGDIVVYRISEQNSEGFKSATNTHVFSSFAGIRHDKNISQEAWEHDFRVVGPAIGEFDASGKRGIDQTITVRGGGSGSMFHTGPETLYPGDAIAAQYPRLNPTERMEQYETMSTIKVPSTMTHKPRPICTTVKVTANNIVSSNNEVSAFIVHNNNLISYPEYRAKVMTGTGPEIGQVRQLAITKKAYICGAAMSGIQAALQFGYVVPTCNSLADVVANPVALSQWFEARAPLVDGGADPVDSIETKQWVPGPSSNTELLTLIDSIRRSANDADGANLFLAAARTWGGRFMPVSPIDLPNRRAAFESQLGVLSTLCGISKVDTVAASENFSLTSTITSRLMMGSVKEYETYLTLRKRLLRSSQAPIIVRNTFGTEVRMRPSAVAQLNILYEESDPLLWKNIGAQYDRTYKDVFARATSITLSGKLFDYVI